MEKRPMKDMMVGRQGLGCMGWSAFYESAARTTEESAAEVFKAAVDAGVTLFNTADFYGPLTAEGYGANLRLLRKCLEKSGVERSQVQIMCKLGVDTRDGSFKHNASASELRRTVDWALEQLGTDYLDILVLNREDPEVPLRESVEALAQLVAEGKGRHIGLSEFSAANVRLAASVAPICCLEMEWSLMSRDLEEQIVPTCRELGICIVAYSPLCRGLLTGAFQEAPKDFRGSGGQPRFAAENLARNLALVGQLEQIAAAKKGCTASQLALAWVHAQGADVFPIP
eukprot:CAMPEP_0115124202 /NCGR_PEP_ID=MMETSP0227-20121206/48143_1 /TAXON_ID=89957 /ORGANISM="Polarella glacialis, Strain CCMP 1383" /LENGTH=284 /DNA_ID=CAMNT_0002527011 /DNA_START=101 /DNA_END=951 /DNA_ORIENTATION=-